MLSGTSPTTPKIYSGRHCGSTNTFQNNCSESLFPNSKIWKYHFHDFSQHHSKKQVFLTWNCLPFLLNNTSTHPRNYPFPPPPTKSSMDFCISNKILKDKIGISKIIGVHVEIEGCRKEKSQPYQPTPKIRQGEALFQDQDPNFMDTWPLDSIAISGMSELGA